MRGDSFGEVRQGHKRNGAIKQGRKVFLGSLFRNGPGGGGGYFRNFWLGMCRWDPGALNLYQPTDQIPEK